MEVGMKRCFGANLCLVLVVAALPLVSCSHVAWSQDSTVLAKKIDSLAGSIEDKVIGWRRDFHRNPELSNREFRTSAKVAEHLESLGIDIRTKIAHTGVVGVLKGGKPGGVVALRADMDALPVTEDTGLPFASKVTSEYNGREVGVMHACGHDMHTAVLMGVAELLAGMRADIPGTVVFLFQPAEEGAPSGERGGAGLMIEEGALSDPVPQAVMGLHVSNDFEVGSVGYRPEGAMASQDVLNIYVSGEQTHGAYPWRGVDPVVVSAQIVLGLQSIVSRQLDLTDAPAVVTVGSIHGGVRSNIIPSEVTMVGTIRALDPAMREDIHARIERTAVNIAESAGAKARVKINRGVPVTYNDPELTERMLPTIQRVTGGKAELAAVHTGAEDFACYAEKVPSLFVYLGTLPVGKSSMDMAPGHSPQFMIDEGAAVYGVRLMASLAVDYLMGE